MHRYSNSSYILLGLVLEQVTELAYAKVIRQRVLAPAGMVNSGFWGLDEVVAGIAEGYISELGEEGQVKRWLRRNIYEATPDAAADRGPHLNHHRPLPFPARATTGPTPLPGPHPGHAHPPD